MSPEQLDGAIRQATIIKFYIMGLRDGFTDITTKQDMSVVISNQERVIETLHTARDNIKHYESEAKK